MAAADTVACKVVIAGERGVGKTSLLHQLMTSHYMAAMNTCSFGESARLVQTDPRDATRSVRVLSCCVVLYIWKVGAQRA